MYYVRTQSLLHANKIYNGKIKLLTFSVKHKLINKRTTCMYMLFKYKGNQLDYIDKISHLNTEIFFLNKSLQSTWTLLSLIL